MIPTTISCRFWSSINVHSSVPEALKNNAEVQTKLIISSTKYIIMLQTVDSEELATILESAGLYFTSSQVQDIVSKVDADDDIALDFAEVLQVSDISPRKFTTKW